jgi:hypothetical protein
MLALEAKSSSFSGVIPGWPGRHLRPDRRLPWPTWQGFLSDEEPLPAWGEQTEELYIGDEVFLANVPEAVWRYELGGYPVL